MKPKDTSVKQTVSNKPNYPGIILKYRPKGASVKLIQQKFGIEVDVDFGIITEKEIKKFQKVKGLVIDGRVGMETWGKLI